jgi:hypothetical protein
MTTIRKIAALVADAFREWEYFVMPASCWVCNRSLTHIYLVLGRDRQKTVTLSQRILVPDPTLLRLFDDYLGLGERHV